MWLTPNKVTETFAMLSMPVFAGTVMEVPKGEESSPSTMVIGGVLLPVYVGEVTVAEAGDVIPAVRPRVSASTAPVQYPAEPLKSETSQTPVPIPQSLALTLSAHVPAGVPTPCW